MRGLASSLRGWATHAAVAAGAGLFFAVAILVSRLRALLGSRGFAPSSRIVLLGTFYNTNWFVSHARPLAATGLTEVLVITDEPSQPLPGVRFVCPPRLLVTLLGRPLSRAVWAVRVGWRERPDLFMGYHLIPNAASALLTARLFGRAACYQMTGGPIEIEGGGIGSENSWLNRLRRPSPLLERLAIATAREFDLVVVRGSEARRWLQERRPKGRVEIVPGSVDPERMSPRSQRDIDLLYVGRFTETKRPLSFVEIVAGVAAARPRLRAVMLGEGPLLDEARALARARGVERCIDFRGRQTEVGEELGCARVFLLTSRSEGLSIAMAEAMTAGAVPVVSRVGDLADLVRDGENGYLVELDDLARFVDCARRLLDEPALWRRLSQAARETALSYVGLERVTSLWKGHLSSLVSARSRAAGAARSGG